MRGSHSPIPQHIAIIMDGNGRWAKQRLQPRFMGHRAGLKAVEAIVKHCVARGVQVLSLFAFSSENWRRPSKEVEILMDLFAHALDAQVQRLHANHIQLRVLGDLAGFSPSLQSKIHQAMALTADNSGLIINVVANYGGRWDMTQAFRQLARQVHDGDLLPDAIDETLIAAHLCTHPLPEPDLFIRTGGEQRVSNFLLWQLAYTELYFTNCLWPEFTPLELDKAITWFGQRERRFGRTSEQLTDAENA